MKLDAILDERHSQFGSFAVNMKLQCRIRKGINILLTETAPKEVVHSVEFLSFMLALKATRCFTATDWNLKAECINDFCGYYNLCVRLLKSTPFVYGIRFYLDNTLFNPILAPIVDFKREISDEEIEQLRTDGWLVQLVAPSSPSLTTW